jgi:hypothetical protein
LQPGCTLGGNWRTAQLLIDTARPEYATYPSRVPMLTVRARTAATADATFESPAGDA